MKGEFVRNIRELIEKTPERVTGHVKVDQVYAHYQHAHPEFHHPDGGGAFYLQQPLYIRADKYLMRCAKAAPHGTIKDAMVKNMEKLSGEVYDRAPWEFGDLRASGNPSVDVDGREVYNRPPMVHRLSEDDLKIKSHLRYLFDPHRYPR